MHVAAVDPRDQTEEELAPVYRANMWPNDHECETVEFREVDVPEVLNWLESKGVRRYSLWVCVPGVGGGVRMIRLAGSDPTSPEDTWPKWAER